MKLNSTESKAGHVYYHNRQSHLSSPRCSDVDAVTAWTNSHVPPVSQCEINTSRQFMFALKITSSSQRNPNRSAGDVLNGGRTFRKVSGRGEGTQKELAGPVPGSGLLHGSLRNKVQIYGVPEERYLSFPARVWRSDPAHTATLSLQTHNRAGASAAGP